MPSVDSICITAYPCTFNGRIEECLTDNGGDPTGEFELIREYQPLDSTTNPSLVLKAVKDPKYAHFLRAALAEDKGSRDVLRCDSHAAKPNPDPFDVTSSDDI